MSFLAFCFFRLSMFSVLCLSVLLSTLIFDCEHWPPYIYYGTIHVSIFSISEISLMSDSIFQRSNCYNSIINTFLIKVPHIRQLRPIHLAPYTNSDIDSDTIRYVNVLSTHNLVSRKLSFCASVCVMNPHPADLPRLNLSFQDWASVFIVIFAAFLLERVNTFLI